MESLNRRFVKMENMHVEFNDLDVKKVRFVRLRCP